jgi:hypothetical protein
MIFERLIVEIGVENTGGFSNDYVSLAENSSAVINGGRKLLVEFPQPQSSRKADTPKSASKKKVNTSGSKAKAKGKKQKSTTVAMPDDMDIDCGLQFTEDGSNSDQDDSIKTGSSFSRSTTPDSRTVLPYEQTKKLVDLIKNCTNLWAQEEQMLGKNVFCRCCVTLLVVSFFCN